MSDWVLFYCPTRAVRPTPIPLLYHERADGMCELRQSGSVHPHFIGTIALLRACVQKGYFKEQ